MIGQDAVQEFGDLMPLLSETAIFLWKDWPKDMQVALYNLQQRTLTVKGTCPHCNHPTAFLLSTNVCGRW